MLLKHNDAIYFGAAKSKKIIVMFGTAADLEQLSSSALSSSEAKIQYDRSSINE